MEVSLKKSMYNIGYYTLASIIILLSVGFMVAISLVGAPLYQQIVYYIWSILLICAVIFDVIATNCSSMKFITGLIIYSIVLLSIVMGIIVYAEMSVNGLIPAGSDIFAIAIGFSMALSVLSVIFYWQGEKLVELKQERKTR